MALLTRAIAAAAMMREVATRVVPVQYSQPLLRIMEKRFRPPCWVARVAGNCEQQLGARPVFGLARSSRRGRGGRVIFGFTAANLGGGSGSGWGETCRDD